MSDDLVKRLRDGIVEYPKRWSGDTHSDKGGPVDYDATDDLLDESADRIEELEAENARLRESATDPCAALEAAVLDALPGRTEHLTFGLEYFSSLAQIAQDAAVDKEAARFACRRLRDKGLAIFQRGLFTEDGEVAGSGYALTDAGRAALQEGGG